MTKGDKEYLYFYLLDSNALKIEILGLLIAQSFVIFGILGDAVTNLFGLVLYQAVILIILYLSVREYIRPNLVLGKDYICIPKVSLLFRKFYKQIKFEEIEEIDITINECSKKSGENILDYINPIFLFDKEGKKYNLNWLSIEKKRFVKDFKKRLGKENWKSKVIIKKRYAKNSSPNK